MNKSVRILIVVVLTGLLIKTISAHSQSFPCFTGFSGPRNFSLFVLLIFGIGCIGISRLFR